MLSAMRPRRDRNIRRLVDGRVVTRPEVDLLQGLSDGAVIVASKIVCPTYFPSRIGGAGTVLEVLGRTRIEVAG